MTLNRLLDDFGILFVYISAFVLLVIATRTDLHGLLAIQIVIFFLYDIRFRLVKQGQWSNYGRDFEGALASITSASTYTSFFIGFIAISLSLIANTGIPEPLKDLINDPYIQVYVFITLSFSGLTLMFIPIPYVLKQKKGKNAKNEGEDEEENREPSEALKNCFFAVLFMEKTVILLLIYIIIQASRAFLS